MIQHIIVATFCPIVIFICPSPIPVGKICCTTTKIKDFSKSRSFVIIFIRFNFFINTVRKGTGSVATSVTEKLDNSPTLKRLSGKESASILSEWFQDFVFIVLGILHGMKDTATDSIVVAVQIQTHVPSVYLNGVQDIARIQLNRAEQIKLM